jgi:hypothetical protein
MAITVPFTSQDTSGQMPPSAAAPVDNSGSLAASATDAASSVSHQQADKLFQMATSIRDASTNMALRDRSQIAQAQGATSSTPTMPGIEMPIFNPERPSPPALQSEIGGGYTNHGLRVSHDKSALVNEISAGVQYAVQKHQDNERTKAMMEFRTLYTAIQANKMLDPNDPNNQADIAHNNEIIKNFFEGKDGKARTKRLEKIMGFDAFNMKKEQEKQQDPYYQAMQQQAGVVANKATGAMSETIPGGIPNPNNVPIGQSNTAPSVANPNAPTGTPVNNSSPNTAMNETIPGMPNPNNSPMWMHGLPPSIQAHLSNIPSVPMPVTLSRDEQRQALRVDAKIAPSADELVKFQSKMAEITKDLNVEGAKLLSAQDLETFKQVNENWREVAGNSSAERIAMINAKVHMADAALGWARLRFEQGKFGTEELDKFGDLMKDTVKTKKDYLDTINETIKTYQNSKPGKALPDDKGVELRQAQDDYLNAQYNWNQYQKDKTAWFVAHGVNINPAGSGITTDTLNGIKKNTGASLSTTAPAYPANTIPGVNVNPGPPPTASASQGNDYTNWYKGSAVPDIIDKFMMTGKYAKGQGNQ